MSINSLADSPDSPDEHIVNPSEKRAEFAAKLEEFNEAFAQFQTFAPHFTLNAEEATEAAQYTDLVGNLHRKALDLGKKFGIDKVFEFHPPRDNPGSAESGPSAGFLHQLEAAMVKKRNKRLFREPEKALEALSNELDEFRKLHERWLELCPKGDVLNERISDREKAYHLERKASWPRLQALYTELSQIVDSGEFEYSAREVIEMIRNYLWALDKQNMPREYGGHYNVRLVKAIGAMQR